VLASENHDNNGGIWITSAAPLSNIVGVHFDGGNRPGLFLDSAYSINVTGSSFYRPNGNSIKMSNTAYSSLTGNNFVNGNALDASYSDILIEDTIYGSSRNTIIGNTFYQSASKTKPGYAIEEKNGGAAPVKNTYSGNAISPNYNTPVIKVLSDAMGTPYTFTPGLGAVGGTPTIGNGTLTGRIIKTGTSTYGEAITVSIQFTLGSRTNLGKGGFYFTIPAPFVSSGLGIGSVYASDASTGHIYTGVASLESHGRVYMNSDKSTGPWSNTSPIPWSPGSYIIVNMTFFP
jgi:hypothetical protein